MVLTPCFPPSFIDYTIDNRVRYFNYDYIREIVTIIKSVSSHLFLVLSLLEKPAISVLYPRSQNITETEPINIFCNATGNPHPKISWRKSGDSRRVFPTDSFLTIPRSLAPRDEGTFICTADNGKYSTEASSIVHFVFSEYHS